MPKAESVKDRQISKSKDFHHIRIEFQLNKSLLLNYVKRCRRRRRHTYLLS